VLKNNLEVLVTAFVYALTLLLVTATALYYAERRTSPEASTFPSIPSAMYASILVLTGNYDTSKECAYRPLQEFVFVFFFPPIRNSFVVVSIAGQWVVAVGATFSIFLIAVPAGMLLSFQTNTSMSYILNWFFQ